MAICLSAIVQPVTPDEEWNAIPAAASFFRRNPRTYMSISSRKAGVDSYRNQLAKNKAYSKAHLNIPRIFNGLVRTHTNRELVGMTNASERGEEPRPTRDVHD